MPIGESCMQRLGKPSRGMAPTLPTHRSLSQLLKLIRILFTEVLEYSPNTSCQVDFFEQSQLTDKRSSFFICSSPISSTGTPWRWITRRRCVVGTIVVIIEGSRCSFLECFISLDMLVNFHFFPFT